MSQWMKGKRGLVMGVANDHSIAWGIAQALAAEGAELAFTFQGEALERRIRPLAPHLEIADHRETRGKCEIAQFGARIFARNRGLRASGGPADSHAYQQRTV